VAPIILVVVVAWFVSLQPSVYNLSVDAELTVKDVAFLQPLFCIQPKRIQEIAVVGRGARVPPLAMCLDGGSVGHWDLKFATAERLPAGPWSLIAIELKNSAILSDQQLPTSLKKRFWQTINDEFALNTESMAMIDNIKDF
jgi:hypothetical protein